MVSNFFRVLNILMHHGHYYNDDHNNCHFPTPCKCVGQEPGDQEKIQPEVLEVLVGRRSVKISITEYFNEC